MSFQDTSNKNLSRGSATFVVLAILRDGPAHGYAIASQISAKTQNLIEFKQGTLYPLLHELERDEFIASEWEILPGKRPRRVYTITNSGLAELDKRLESWREFSTAMHHLTTAPGQ